MGLRLWGFAYLGCGYRPSMQYIPQKNIKSATAAFADSLLIVCYELSYPHFMERRGSLYFSSEQKGVLKTLRFSHALHNVITYEIISFHKGTLVILTGLPAQHLMAILCDEYHDFPLG